MKFTKVIALCMALVLCLCVMTSCGEKKTEGSDKINATIILVLEDGSEVNYDISVSKDQTIRQALYEAGLIDDENSVSMFVSNIDGHIADAINDGVTWIVCDENGEQRTGGASGALCMLDAFNVNDGDVVRLVYTVVPNFDD